MSGDRYFTSQSTSRTFTSTSSPSPAVSMSTGTAVAANASRLETLKRALHIDPNARSFRLSRPTRTASRRDDRVSRVLDGLGDDWVVLHDIPVGATGRVDHLVIGPAGVFVMNVRDRIGRRAMPDPSLPVGARSRSDVAVSLRQAEQVSAALTAATEAMVHVQSVLVLTSSRPDRQRDGLVLVTAAQLRRWMRSQKVVRLDEVTRRRIERVARLQSTWH